MGFFKNLVGTMNSYFQVDGPSGPRVKNNAGVFQSRNSDDTAFARFQVATPTADDDAVTKLYADTLEKPLIVARQADTSASLPTNTGVRGFVVVTTPGTGAAIGDVLYDDGSASGTMSILSAVEGRTIAVTDSLTGGSIEFDADSIYIWDDDGTSWLKVGDVGSVTGADRIIRFALGTATVDSSSSVPANARVTQAWVDVTTPYNAGATISLGIAGGTVDLVQTTTDNVAQFGNTYVKEQDTSWGVSAAAVRATISATSGVGVATVFYSVPNA